MEGMRCQLHEIGETTNKIRGIIPKCHFFAKLVERKDEYDDQK